jgi:hypothetical protein
VSGKKQARVELHELAFLYALGALEGEDQRIFEEHLRRGCTACEAELRSLGEVTASLGSAVQAEPPAGLRSRLLAKVRSAPRVPGVLFEQGGLLISRSAEVAWQTMAPGIEFKPLHIDQARKYNTCLVRKGRRGPLSEPSPPGNRRAVHAFRRTSRRRAGHACR